MATCVGEPADAVNAGISVARGNYFDAVLDVGALATGPVGNVFTIARRTSRVAKASSKADEVADTVVHGNSLSSAKPQHGYEVVDQSGKVQKVGVSGQPLNKDGTSRRANRQANAANKTRTGNDQVKGG